MILEQTQPGPPLVVASWLSERQCHGSPGSVRPGAAALSLYRSLHISSSCGEVKIMVQGMVLSPYTPYESGIAENGT